MKISTTLASEIVKNLKDVINQDINLMDSRGTIIASTDESRVNTFHEAAKKCVEENRIIYINSNDQYKGGKPGINLPVEFENKVIGVIGISGKQNVKKYGTIIKKMTEILLKEEWIKENQTLEMENNRNLIDALIHDRLKRLEYFPENLSYSKKYIAYSVINNKNFDSKSKDKILRYISINNLYSNTYLSFIHNELIILFIENDRKDVYENISKIKYIFKNKLGVELNFGVSKSFYTTKNTSIFYKQAQRSYKWIRNTKEKIGFFDKLGLGSLITAIDEKEIYEYSYNILKNIKEEQLEEFKELIYLYAKFNGSIGKIANYLFMHKNTIQYRLNKLKDLTGYNPRDINDYMVLYFAFLGLE